MALVLADRVLETTTTAGSGTITLAGAGTGYQSFAVVGDGNTTYYTITDGTNWEVGIGTYTASGTTLSRDTVLSSSNGGAKVTFPIGVKNVFVDYPAGRAVYGGEVGTVTISSLAATSAVITNLAATSANITTLSSGSANITQLQSTSATVTTLTSSSANITQLQSTSATITTLTGSNWAATSLTLTNALKVPEGGTGVDSTPTNGQLLIGNGTGYTLANLTAGSGITITNGTGTISLAAGGLPTVTVTASTAITAAVNTHYVLTAATAATVTLPASPTISDTIYVTVANGLTTNVVARNGKNIQGLAEDLTLDDPYASAQLRYSDATEGWILA